MIKSKRVFHYLILTSFFSFFSFTLTNVILMFNSSLSRLLSSTFLSMFMSLFEVIINIIFKVLSFFSIFLFVGSTVALFIVFYLDFVKGQTVR